MQAKWQFYRPEFETDYDAHWSQTQIGEARIAAEFIVESHYYQWNQPKTTHLMLRQAAEGPWQKCTVEVEMRPTFHSCMVGEFGQ